MNVDRKRAAVGAGVIAAMAIYVFAASGHERETPRPTTRTLRDVALEHARTRLGEVNAASLTGPPPDPTGTLSGARVTCRFVDQSPNGTSPKFDCALPDGEVVRVKYGHEPEIHAEVAATRLLSALGYAADRVSMVPSLRCYGCPPNPFLVMRILELTGSHGLYSAFASASARSRPGAERVDGSDPPAGDEEDYVDFEWVAVERKFEGTPIEGDDREGWAWWELKDVEAPIADLDALRLVAVFITHWDNKEDNQRLVCLDATPRTADQPCADPLLMIQDVGATFGPMKVNLAQWGATPVWSDRATCTVSMRALPYQGSTFTDARITDAARVRVGRDLASFTDAELREWLTAARFPEFYTSTDDERDLAMWTRAFRHRVEQILYGGPCPQ
jgi:hypothetical protein